MRIAALRWGAIVACMALGWPSVSVARSDPATMSVGRTPVGRAIAPDFLGMAFEYGSIPAWVGPDPAQPNPVLVQLIRNLNPSGRPLIRIGGLSTDRSWWPVPGMALPRGVTYALGPAWSGSVVGLARALNARLMLGVNLEADSPALAQAEALEFQATIGRRYVSALDIGNEPPLYDSVPWYRVKDGKLVPWYLDEGREVFSRGLSWGPRAFVADYARILRALPDIPIAGPDTQQPGWFAAYRRFVSPRSRVRMLVSHGYGLNSCDKTPASAAYPSIAHLLSGYALHDLLGQLTPYVTLAHRDGARFRIDEMGSVTCNGRQGVSDTMASALWAAAALFSVARDGVDGVNLHSYPKLPNGLFDFSHASGRWTAAVHPIYYGALLFARAAPPGSRLVSVRLHGPASLRAWATAGPGAARHVAIVNESATTAAAVVVSGLGGGPAELERLSASGTSRTSGDSGASGASGASRASGASATRGITLGGRTFGAATATGRLAAPVRRTVAARAGTYRVTVPAASALVLTRASSAAR